MRISRRHFACGIVGAAALGSAAARPADRGIVEWRAYALGSVLPPLEVLQRHEIHPASVKPLRNGTIYVISFDSAEARVKAWDRFNTDEDWCTIRDAGTVALQEVQLYPAGKIFEISL